MTMREIDEARSVLDHARTTLRNLKAMHLGTADAEAHVERCEAIVEAKLREWWAQGCRDTIEDP